ncbi:MAG: hypothetical protein HY513_05930 [Candidatus Aenigmarchaeota archaeon]|nr:hypothetical protein [Candidatus Aenigmarchaeota archaeon]
MPHHGYTETNGIYTKDTGSPEDWKPDAKESFTSRYLGDARYHTMSNTTIHKKDGQIVSKQTTKLPPNSAEANIFSISEPYAWSHTPENGFGKQSSPL